MALGFPPKYSLKIPLSEFNLKYGISMAKKIGDHLGWRLSSKSEQRLVFQKKISWISYGETIEIICTTEGLHITSSTSGLVLWDLGVNKKNVLSFRKLIIADVNQLDQLRELDKEIDYTPSEISSLSAPIDTVPSSILPQKGFWVTPVLCLLNVAVYLVMVAAGVSLTAPTPEDLLIWGGNMRDITGGGEWYRLLTSTFVHGGFLHLLVNCYTLLLIGRFVEPRLGSGRTLLLYLTTGLVASASSYHFNDFMVCVGASGAIFGLVGGFLALLLFDGKRTAVERSLLTAMIIYTGYNILAGFNSAITDNAAHIGGLTSGFVLGLLLVIALRKKAIQGMGIVINSLALLTGGIMIFGLLVLSPVGSFERYQHQMDEISRLEYATLNIFNFLDTGSDELLKNELLQQCIPKTKKCLLILEEMESQNLSPVLLSENQLLQEYFTLRLNQFRVLYRSLKYQDESLLKKVDGYQTKIEEKLLAIRNLVDGFK